MAGEKMFKVLVVDDSKAMQTILRRGLNDLGYSNLDIKSCNDGLEALESVRTWDPDLVLSDWHMPEMNGLELIQAMNREMLNIDIGFVTTETSEDRISELMREGAKFVVQKPFDLKTLHKAVLPILQGSSAGEQAIADAQSSEADTSSITFPSPSIIEKLLGKLCKRDILMEPIDEVDDIDIRLPAVLGLFEDSEAHKVQSVMLLDIAAASIVGAAMDDMDEEMVHIATSELALNKRMVENCTSFIELASAMFYNRDLAETLTLRSVNIVRRRTDTFEKLVGDMNKQRVDVEIAVPGYGSGRMCIINT